MNRSPKEIAQDFFRPLSWIRVLLGVAILLGVYWWITKPAQNVKVQKGGIANFYNAPKKTFIPFVELYTGKEKNYEGLNYGIKAGLRIEF